jgi:osmotically-inducible protein OsmY
MKKGEIQMSRKLAPLAVFLVIVAIGCGSFNRATPSSMDNTAMKADVKGKIAEIYPKETFDIGVTVDNGMVTLSGQVDTSEQRQRIGDAAGSVNGVKSVINNIRVK